MDLDKKLEEARNNRHGYANKRALKETADDKLKAVYALVYSDAPDGTVAEKDAWIRKDSRYKDAIICKENTWAEWIAAELYMKILFAQLDKYRTDKSYDKFIDKAHV